MNSSFTRNSWYPIASIARARGISEEYLQSVKYELDKHIYYYGKQFPAAYESNYTYDQNQLNAEFKFVEDLIVAIDNYPDWNAFYNTRCGTPIVVCNAYFQLKERLLDAGLAVQAPIWENTSYTSDLEKHIRILCTLIRRLFAQDFQLILEERFVTALGKTESIIKRYYQHPDFISLIIPYQVPYFEYIGIKIFRELGKKSILSIHGLSHSYDVWSAKEYFPHNAENYLTDYYLVWGEYIAEQFPRHGISRDRVLVTGHPDYDSYSTGKLRFGLENILVCTKAFSGAPIMNLPIHQNRGDIIHYIYSIQDSLKKVGVKKATLRVHPSESKEWYATIIDKDFYTMDESGLHDSLKRSSLVIGATSTVFIEALMHGVNYLLYDPYHTYEHGHNLVYDPPFDGSDPRVPLAKNSDQLLHILQNQIAVDSSCIADLVKTPFDLSPMLALFSDHIQLSRRNDQSHVLTEQRTEFDTLIIDSLAPFNQNATALLPVLKSIEYLKNSRVPGAIVGCGLNTTCGIMAACLKLIELQDTSRELFISNFNQEVLASQSALTQVKESVYATSYPKEKFSFNKVDLDSALKNNTSYNISMLYLDSSSDGYELLKEYHHAISAGGLIVTQSEDVSSSIERSFSDLTPYFAQDENGVTHHYFIKQ